MHNIIPTLLLASTLIVCGQTLAAEKSNSKGPQTIRFYKVNNQQQENRLNFTRKKAKQPGCHNLLKRSRVKKVVQIGYAQCQLFTEKDCATHSVIKVSRDDKAEQIKDAEEEYQLILTDIIKNREEKEREQERNEREAAEQEALQESELELELDTNQQETADADVGVIVDDTEAVIATAENEQDLESADSEADSTDSGEDSEGKKSKKKKKKEPKDYEAIEAGLVNRLEAIPPREQIISATPESLTNLLTKGFGWYPESENLRGVKIRSWSCSLE